MYIHTRKDARKKKSENQGEGINLIRAHHVRLAHTNPRFLADDGIICSETSRTCILFTARVVRYPSDKSVQLQEDVVTRYPREFLRPFINWSYRCASSISRSRVFNQDNGSRSRASSHSSRYVHSQAEHGNLFPMYIENEEKINFPKVVSYYAKKSREWFAIISTLDTFSLRQNAWDSFAQYIEDIRLFDFYQYQTA